MKCLMTVEQPTHDLLQCRDINRDCHDILRPLKDYPYCSTAALPAGFEQCRRYDAHDLQPKTGDASVFVPTAFTTFNETKCSDNAMFEGETSAQKCASLWLGDRRKMRSHLVAGPESFHVIIKHIFTTLSMQDWWSHGAQGFFEGIDGTLQRIDCAGESCPESLKPSWNFYPSCGAAKPGIDACVATVRGDVISVAKLLEAANVSLDSPVEGGTRRTRGVSLLVDVEYGNSNPADYWQRPFGSANRYIYRVREIDVDESYARVTSGNAWKSDAPERELTRTVGVSLRIYPRGHLSTLDLSGLVLSFVVALTITGLTDIVIGMIFLLYRKGALGYCVAGVFDQARLPVQFDNFLQQAQSFDSIIALGTLLGLAALASGLFTPEK